MSQHPPRVGVVFPGAISVHASVKGSSSRSPSDSERVIRSCSSGRSS